MSRLYLRKARVLIIPPTGESRLIELLRIKFKCEKTNEGHPNKADIEIYNLNDTSRGLLESKNTKCQLEVGYEETVEPVFIGNVLKTEHKQEDADIITKVQLHDGGNRFRNARIEKGYPPGVKTKFIFQELADAMGLPLGAQVGLPDLEYSQGATFSGLVRKQLDDLTAKNGLEWSIQDETLQIIPKAGFTADSVIVISSDSGMIGQPTKTDKGVEFSALLNPQLRPGKRVEIRSRRINGIFKIRKVSQEGDSQDGDFLSKCEATK